jgi:uncharacterized protein YjbK
MFATIEKELKYMLCQVDYYNLKGYLDKISTIKRKDYQTNYYIDTESFLLKSKCISVRIREINNKKFFLTVKHISEEVRDNFHIKKEYNKEIGYDDFQHLINSNDFSFHVDMLELIKGIIMLENDDMIIGIRGFLKTERISYLINELSTEIFLDKNVYLGKVDYEVEHETDNYSVASERLNSIFESLKIIPQVNSDSKTNRFKNLLMELNK